MSDTSKWLVGCCVTSNSVIFQLYSDWTVVQFPNLDMLPGTQRHVQLGVFSVPSLPRHGHWNVQRRLYLLAIRGPTHGEGMPGIEPGSTDLQSSPLPLRHRGGLIHQTTNNSNIWTGVRVYQHQANEHCFLF